MMLRSLAFLSLALVPACVQTDLEVDELEAELATGEGFWHQGMGYSARLMRADEGFCYLTRVTGRFVGQGEMLRLSSHDGYWWLDGASGQIDVGGSARCVPFRDLGVADNRTSVRSKDASAWSEDYLNITWSSALLGGLDQLCYLSRVQGSLNGGGEKLWLVPEFPLQRWRLDPTNDNGDGHDYGTFGEGTCVGLGLPGDVRYLGGNFGSLGEHIWRQGQPWLPMAAVGEGFCYLTGITGKFNGGGEVVEIRDIGGVWHLGGASQQVDVAAAARCVAYDQASGKVLDGGFEEQQGRSLAPPWSGEGSAPKGFDVGLGYAQAGANNAWIVNNGVGWNAITQVVPVRPNQWYRIKLQARTYATDYNAYFGVRDATNAVIAEVRFGRNRWCFDLHSYTNFLCASGYEPLEVTFWSGASTWVRLFAGYHGPGRNSYMQLDEASMTWLP